MDVALVAAVLRRVGAAAAADEPVDEHAIEALAGELGVDPSEVERACDDVVAKGLAWLGEDGSGAQLRRAGRQFLALDGEVDRSVLSFLPGCIDDLNARGALLAAGTLLVDQFQDALLEGEGVGYAQGLVPAAFQAVVTDHLALQLYSAAVALLVRLSDEQPAGCVGEEIVAVSLMQQAEGWLDMEVDDGDLTAEQAQAATSALRGLFELFQDDDVLDLFAMEEPADAAVAGHSLRNRQLGIGDQRVEAWFQPFGWTAPTGYLSDRASD